MQCKMLTFDSIQDYSESELHNLPKNVIVECCITDLKQGKRKLEVLEFLLVDYTKTLQLLSIEDVIWNKLCPEITIFVVNIVEHLNNYSNDAEHQIDCIQNARRLIEILISVLDYLKGFIGEFQWRHIRSLESCIINMLVLFYQYSRSVFNRTEEISAQFLSEFKLFYLNCKAMQSLIIFIVASEEMHIFNDTSNQEMHLFVDLIDRLTGVAKQITNLDVKSTAEIWKCLMKLVSDYSEQLKSQPVKIWLKNCVEILTNEIENSITAINRDGVSGIDRIIKVNSFYLNILLKLATIYQGQYFVGDTYIINVLIECFRVEKSIDDHLKPYIQQNFITGLTNVIILIHGTDRFARTLYETISNQSYATIELYHIVINALVRENNPSQYAIYLSSVNNNLITLLLKTIPNNTNPNKTLDYLSMFTMKNFQNENLPIVEETIILSVFNSNFLISWASVDLWTWVLRRISSESVTLQYFRFWLNMYFKTKNVFVKMLVRTLYDLIHVQDVRNGILNVKTPKANIRILSILGLDTIPDIEIRKQTFDQIEVNLVEKIDEFVTSGRHLHEIIICLDLLSTSSMDTKSQHEMHKLAEALKKLWSFVMILDPEDITKMSKMIVALFRASINFRKHLKNVIPFNHITNMLRIFDDINVEFIKLSLEYEQKINTDSKSNVCCTILTKTKFYTIKTKGISNSDSESDDNISDTPTKRLKLDNVDNLSEHERLTNILNELEEIGMVRNLTNNEILRIKSIINILNMLIK